MYRKSRKVAPGPPSPPPIKKSPNTLLNHPAVINALRSRVPPHVLAQMRRTSKSMANQIPLRNTVTAVKLKFNGEKMLGLVSDALDRNQPRPVTYANRKAAINKITQGPLRAGFVKQSPSDDPRYDVWTKENWATYLALQTYFLYAKSKTTNINTLWMIHKGIDILQEDTPRNHKRLAQVSQTLEVLPRQNIFTLMDFYNIFKLFTKDTLQKIGY